MKKALVLTLVLVMIASCAFAEGKILMSSAYYTAPYGSPLQEAVQAKAEELGYEIQIVDGEENADKQLAQFRTAVADGYDALIYWPGDQASTPPVVEYLNSTGLPLGGHQHGGGRLRNRRCTLHDRLRRSRNRPLAGPPDRGILRGE